MAFGTINLGRLALREALSAAVEAQTTSAGRTMKLTGQEAVPAVTLAQLAATQDDLPGMVGAVIPVRFTDKADRNGYYQVGDAQADLMNWQNELVTCTWTTTLLRIGTDTEVDLESRLTGASARNNSFAATGERTHSPPIGHYAYWSGTTQPSVVTRTGSDGSQVVYRGLPITSTARWGCTVANYPNGRCRFVDGNAIERAGINFTVAGSGWNINNGLIQVKPGAGVLSVGSWTSGAYAAKTWDILVAGSSLGVPTTATVLRNEYETVVLRLLWTQAAPGRVTADVTIRRGSRLVELYVQAEFSSTIKIVRQVTEAGTAGTGFVRATANDGNGNRYIVGSAKTFTNDLVIGGVSVTSAVVMDAFIGVELAGSSAVSGDQAADLYAAYLGQPAETVQAVRR